MLLFIRLVGAAGALLCAALLALLIISPKTVERSALGFAKAEIATELKARYPALTDGRVAEGAKRLSKRLGLRKDALDRNAESELPEMISRTISAYCGCTDETKIATRAETIRDGWKARIAALGIAQSNLADVIKGQYDRIISALKTDLMIFLSTNLIAFAGVFIVSFAGRENRGLVVIPGLLLLIAAGAASWIYLAEQDWFYAIIFQNYYGWGYAAIVGVIFGLLMDIIVNRARVCLKIAANLPSAMVPVAPC
ncbi:MAG: hypothetical protein AAFV19_17610 [Pseudomonadota bacterium]